MGVAPGGCFVDHHYALWKLWWFIRAFYLLPGLRLCIHSPLAGPCMKVYSSSHLNIWFDAEILKYLIRLVWSANRHTQPFTLKRYTVIVLASQNSEHCYHLLMIIIASTFPWLLYLILVKYIVKMSINL